MKGKRSIITPENEALIKLLALDNLALPRNELAKKLSHDIKWQGLPPEIEVLERKISYYRNNIHPEDKPWGLSALKEYPIPPELIPIVIRGWAYSRAELGHIFTIRDAKWVVRFSGIYKELKDLVGNAIQYSQGEIMTEITEGKIIYDNLDAILQLYSKIIGEDLSPELRIKICEVKGDWLNRQSAKIAINMLKERETGKEGKKVLGLNISKEGIKEKQLDGKWVNADDKEKEGKQ
jgi:hypothetical protein